MGDPESDDEAARRSVERLTKVLGQKLPRAIRVEVLAHGQRAHGPLVDLLRTGGPVAASHAARLLGALKVERAIPHLLAVMSATVAEEVVAGAGEGLASLGPAAVEPTLQALGAAAEEQQRQRLLGVLAACGVHDPRVTAALLDALEADTTRKVASIAARHGDPQVVERIEALFHATQPTDQDSAERVIELGVALVAAGRFGDAHMAHMNAAYDALGRALQALRAAAGRDADGLDDAEDAPDSLDDVGAGDDDDDDDLDDDRRDLPGRNEPCWCGGGKKFKACHGRA